MNECENPKVGLREGSGFINCPSCPDRMTKATAAQAVVAENLSNPAAAAVTVRCTGEGTAVGGHEGTTTNPGGANWLGWSVLSPGLMSVLGLS